jgi:hypothetical protein
MLQQSWCLVDSITINQSTRSQYLNHNAVILIEMCRGAINASSYVEGSSFWIDVGNHRAVCFQPRKIVKSQGGVASIGIYALKSTKLIAHRGMFGNT